MQGAAAGGRPTCCCPMCSFRHVSRFHFHFSLESRPSVIAIAVTAVEDSVSRHLSPPSPSAPLDARQPFRSLSRLGASRISFLHLCFDLSRRPLSLGRMITDIIMLLFLFGLVGGILMLVSYVSPTPSSDNQKRSPSSSSASASASSSGVTALGSGASFDWNKGEVRLKTNMRPVTQQDLLENAQRHGQDGGRFVVDHAESFRFGNKDSSPSS